MSPTKAPMNARAREAWRRRWRAWLVPHWPRLAREVLTPREARVLSLRVGLVSDVGLAHAAIARRLDLSTTAVAAIERRAITKIAVALQLGGHHELA